MTSILIAVVVGLSVSNWDEDRKERRRAELALASVVNELADNRQALEDVLPYYGEIVGTIQTMIDRDGDQPLAELAVEGWMGFRPPSLRTGAFAVATGSGALEHVDLPAAAQVYQAYEALEDFETVTRAAVAATMSGIERTSDLLTIMAILTQVAADAHSVVGSTLDTLSGELSRDGL